MEKNLPVLVPQTMCSYSGLVLSLDQDFGVMTRILIFLFLHNVKGASAYSKSFSVIKKNAYQYRSFKSLWYRLNYFKRKKIIHALIHFQHCIQVVNNY